MFKDLRGNEDKLRDWLQKFNMFISSSQLVAQLEKINNVYWAKPMTMDLKQRDNFRWCTFHRERGHATEECRSLKCEFKELLQRGYSLNMVVEPNKWGAEKQHSRSPH